MTKDSKPNFEISGELRQLAQRNVEQARKAVEDFIAAGRKAVATMEGQRAVAQTSVKNAAHKAMGFAEQNIAISFEFANKLVHAKDVMDIVQIQTDFVKTQTEALREQAKELGQTVA